MNTNTNYAYIKGISKNKEFGDVLSVDFSPLKICSYDCVYCRLGRTTDKTIQRSSFYPLNDVFSEIQNWINQNSSPDYVLLTGSGEPTLYHELGPLVELINTNFPELKTVVYSNGSLLHCQEVRRELSTFDLIIINLNSDNEDIFQRICRPQPDIKLAQVIDGLRKLRKEYTGQLWIDIVLVNNVNTGEDTLESLMKIISDIKPERCMINQHSKKEKGPNEKQSIIPERLREKWSKLSFDVIYNI